MTGISGPYFAVTPAVMQPHAQNQETIPGLVFAEPQTETGAAGVGFDVRHAALDRRNWLALAILIYLALTTFVVAGCERDPAKDAPITAAKSPEAVNPPATIGTAAESVVVEFDKRVKEYMALHDQLNGTLKQPPDRATPLQIDAHQRALAALIAKGRPDAKQGDVFEPKMQEFVRGLVRSVITGANGAAIKASLMDENPMNAKIAINGRYPDDVPMATMPPDVLAALPKLPEVLEYRFVGNRLILLDTRAHIIVDYVTDTFDAGK